MPTAVRIDGRGIHCSAFTTAAGGWSRWGDDTPACSSAVPVASEPAKCSITARTNGTMSCGPRLKVRVMLPSWRGHEVAGVVPHAVSCTSAAEVFAMGTHLVEQFAGL